MTDHEHSAVIGRLKKIEGQVRGLARMIEDDRYCIDILQQIQAVRAALARVEGLVLKRHAANCVEDALRSGDAADQRRKFTELVDLVERVRR
ncbi:metal-sensitive transcriptional regulator [soil metagenome]